MGRAAGREGYRGFTLEALPFEFGDGTTLHRISKVAESGDLLTDDFGWLTSTRPS
jgi:hypothetical protein